MSYVPTYIHNQKHKRFVVLFSLIFSKDDIPFLSSGFLTSILSSLILPHVYCFFLLVPYSSSTLLISFLILIFTSSLLIRNILLHHYLCLTASQPPFPRGLRPLLLRCLLPLLPLLLVFSPSSPVASSPSFPRGQSERRNARNAPRVTARDSFGNWTKSCSRLPLVSVGS